MKQLWVVGLALFAAGCGGSSPTSHAAAAKVPFAGKVQLPFVSHTGGNDQQFAMQGTSCVGKGHFAGIKPGASVTILDAAGTIVGTATLSEGVPEFAPGNDVFKTYCRFPFSADVAASDFYTVRFAQYPTVIVKRSDADSALVQVGT